MYDEMTADGVYVEGEEGELAALDYLIKHSPVTRASDMGEHPWAKVAAAGTHRIEGLEPSDMGHPYSDYDPDQPLYAMGHFINRKEPWPTLTGRQQFYIDHEWFLEVGEGLVVHKEPVQAGGPYPLRLVSGHARWSIHSIWRTSSTLLRLQRGEPVAYISEADARARHIVDHDRIRVFNDVGEFTVRAKVSATAQPGMLICYHAWDGTQFPGGAVQNDVVAAPIRPLSLVGEYGQLHYPLYTQPHLTTEIAAEMQTAADESAVVRRPRRRIRPNGRIQSLSAGRCLRIGRRHKSSGLEGCGSNSPPLSFGRSICGRANCGRFGNELQCRLIRHSPDSLLVREHHTTLPPSLARDHFRGRLLS